MTSAWPTWPGGNNVSPGTVRRWAREVLRLLAARAPRLDRALTKIARQGGEVVLINGTLIRTGAPQRQRQPQELLGQAQTHGLLFPALTDTRGNLL
ncbi:hypothetical protein [Nonomuraea fuscirosea]|uniref:hypothetical protein n=1 Tax=Nonomuraea fuscirosea TaxID=1291556 RepID=UPI0034242BED